jgi:hypothetical protein
MSFLFMLVYTDDSREYGPATLNDLALVFVLGIFRSFSTMLFVRAT